MSLTNNQITAQLPKLQGPGSDSEHLPEKRVASGRSQSRPKNAGITPTAMVASHIKVCVAQSLIHWSVKRHVEAFFPQVFDHDAIALVQNLDKVCSICTSDLVSWVVTTAKVGFTPPTIGANWTLKLRCLCPKSQKFLFPCSCCCPAHLSIECSLRHLCKNMEECHWARAVHAPTI